MRECGACGVRDIPMGVDWPWWINGRPVHRACLPVRAVARRTTCCNRYTSTGICEDCPNDAQFVAPVDARIMDRAELQRRQDALVREGRAINGGRP